MRSSRGPISGLTLSRTFSEMNVVRGVALAGQADHLVTGNLSDFPAECRRECAVVSLAQFTETGRKGNQ